jgi:hypothetical protein
MKIITGERLQEKADVYFCDESYIGSCTHNDYIISQNKHKFISSLREHEVWDNPRTIFCYGDWLHLFSEKLDLFKNDFVLISHNSDYNVTENDTSLRILNHQKVVEWRAQNVCFDHPKLKFLPIGIANRQWSHGSLFEEFYKRVDLKSLERNKLGEVYFNFQISTNAVKRQPCYDSLCEKLEFLPGLPALENFERLAKYKYCICPEGNGVDTHRLWEALYLKCIPIVIDSPFIRVIQKQANIPLVVLSSWDDFCVENLPPYEDIIMQAITPSLNLEC